MEKYQQMHIKNPPKDGPEGPKHVGVKKHKTENIKT
jgi:hypothetical protein